MIDKAHWRKLAGMGPAEVCRLSGAAHDAEDGSYRLRLLSDEVTVNVPDRTVSWADADVAEDRKPPGFNEHLVSVVYLVTAGATGLESEAWQRSPDDWVNPRSLPLGDFFYRGFHEIPTAGLETGFSRDPQGLLEAGRRLGASVAPEGDAGIVLLPLPRVKLKYVFWAADDEFPARATVLVRRDTPRYLLLDALWVLCGMVSKALLAAR